VFNFVIDYVPELEKGFLFMCKQDDVNLLTTIHLLTIHVYM